MRISAGIVFGLAVVVLVPCILWRDLWAPDEPRHAEVARTMLVTSDWLVPHLNGEVYPDKPPPPFWLVAGAMKVLGMHDWSARIPTVVAAAVTLGSMVSIAALLDLEGVAGLAVLILATAFRSSWSFQRVSLDVLMTAGVSCAMWAWLRQWLGRGASAANGAAFFGAIAVGAAMKGPLALLVPLSAAIGHAAATKRMRQFANVRFLGVGIAVLAAVTAAWVVPLWMRTDAAYRFELFFQQSAGRIANAWNHQGPPWYYLVDLPAEFMPWTPLLVVAIVAIARTRPVETRSAWTFLVAWTVPTFVFLSIVESKRGNYLLPLFPGFALLTALGMTTALRGDGRLANAARAAVGFGLVVVVVAAIAVGIGPWIPQVRERGIDLPWFVTVAGLAIAGVAARAGRDSLRTRATHRAALVVGSCAVGLHVLVASTVLPAVDAAKSARPIAEALRRELPPGAYVPLLGLRAEDVRFYSGLDCREVESKEAFADALRDPRVRLAVADAKDLAKLRKKGLLKVTVHERPARAVGSNEGVVILDVGKTAAASPAAEPGAKPD